MISAWRPPLPTSARIRLSGPSVTRVPSASISVRISATVVLLSIPPPHGSAGSSSAAPASDAAIAVAAIRRRREPPI
ncbi:hypothetical protein COO09_15260 [Rhizorhabdus dicambivorans]|uniref:Uncharacterized protein n=1 Tax=Rhizorhabdus dicambivorans TaxID=1850238 RepID=A0A2A4FUP8_9SPHN|nr:hypothetical protein COO09_15260 [Rhizorhabdus dicambivorans]